MKSIFVLVTLFCCFAAPACKKEKPTVVAEPMFTECLEAKFEEFKQLPWAAKIVKVARPSGTLYWLVDSYIDTGESILDEQCTLFCTADCECDDSVVQCDSTFYDYPMEVIWEQ